MNTDWVLFHLREAHEELTGLIAELEKDPAREELWVGMGHLYHHLNTAWNSQDVSPAEVDAHTQEDFDRWRRFPKNDELGL